jgi:hypothetical protein
MTASEKNFQPKSKEREPSYRLRRQIGAFALAIGVAGGGGFTAYEALKPDAAPAGREHEETAPAQPTAEFGQEKEARIYQREALKFAKTAADKLPSQAIATPIETSEGAPYSSYKITDTPSYTPSGEDKGIIRAVLNLKRGTGSIEITGIQEAPDKSIENFVSTTIELNPDNPLLTTDSDAPIMFKDYVQALKSAKDNDVRSVVMHKKGIEDQINGDFIPGQPPRFAGREKDSPPTSLPTISSSDFTAAAREILNYAGR